METMNTRFLFVEQETNKNSRIQKFHWIVAYIFFMQRSPNMRPDKAEPRTCRIE